MTHTYIPGPWRFEHGAIVAFDPDFQRTVRLADIPDHDDEGQAAIARLIAAAPDLLAALDRLAHVAKLLGADQDEGAALHQANAAIARATS